MLLPSWFIQVSNSVFLYLEFWWNKKKMISNMNLIQLIKENIFIELLDF